MSHYVLRTSNRYEIDIAVAARSDAGVPFSATGEASGGLSAPLGMIDYNVGHTGHASDYCVSVPDEAVEVTLCVLRDFPISGVIDPGDEE